MDLEVEEDQDQDGDDEENKEFAMVRGRDMRLRSRSLHRRARSLSPLRNSPSPFQSHQTSGNIENDIEKKTEALSTEEEATPCGSAASSRSSSSGRSSKRLEFLKDFLRSKSEGRGGVMKEKFWYKLTILSCQRQEKSKFKFNSKFDAQGNKDVWVDRFTGEVCISISAKALAITGIEDWRYWNWIPTDESRYVQDASTEAHYHNAPLSEEVGKICRENTFSPSSFLKFNYGATLNQTVYPVCRVVIKVSVSVVFFCKMLTLSM